MSNRRFIEISSSNRNRNQYPSPAEFEIPFSPSRSLNTIVTTKGYYSTNSNKVLSQTIDIADPVINGVVYYQWYGSNGLYNSGVITNVSGPVGTYVYDLSVSLVNSTITTGYNVYINNSLMGTVSAGSTTSLIKFQSAVEVQIPINSTLVIVNNTNNIDSSTIQSPYSSANGISSFYVNVSDLKCPYKTVLNYYTGYMLYITTSAGTSQAGIINSYTPSTGLFTVVSPLLTTQTWSGGAVVTIVDPSNCTSSPITDSVGGTIYVRNEKTLVLPFIDASGKNILEYDQSYNGYYATYEKGTIFNYSKVVSYDFLTNTLRLENSFPDWDPSNPFYTLRKTLPTQLLKTISVTPYSGTVSLNSTGNVLFTNTSIPSNFNYNGLQINISGQSINNVVSYDATTITLQTSLNGTVLSGTTYTILLQFNQQLNLSNCIFLSQSANNSDNYYNGQYIYVYSQQVADNKNTSLRNIQGVCYYINSYIGNGHNVCFISPVNPPSLNGATLYYPSYNSEVTNSQPSPGTIINIVSFSNDNYTPLIYNGSVVSQNETVAYEISLVNLTLPNISLKTGSRLAYYPYIYVELSNVTASSSSSKNVIYSNNPHSNRALFLVPITDITDPLRSPFIKLDAGSMVQTVKFKPNDCLRFSVFLQNGETIQTVASDYYSPSSPNQLVQIDALFGIKRL
jgi:hypothetical protein